MNIKTQILIVLISLVSFSTYAQKVLIEGNKVIIDASELTSASTEKKAVRTDGTDLATGSKTKENLGSELSNATLYHKFQVHPTNNATNLSWSNAISFCANLTTDGGGWRLPTQRELMLIWILHSKLATIGSSLFTPLTSALNVFYTCASEWNASNGYGLYPFGNGILLAQPKKNLYYVRCIRDL